MRRRAALISALVVPAAVLALTAAAPASTLGACTARDLSGSMKLIPNSQGAGNLEYKLTLTNKSNDVCQISGVPGLVLLGASGQRLPTKVLTTAGQGTYPEFSLASAQSATSTLRFSPDVAGTGDKQKGACEPVAHRVRVTIASPGSGTLTVPVSPPTSVCERGSLQATPLKQQA